MGKAASQAEQTNPPPTLHIIETGNDSADILDLEACRRDQLATKESGKWPPLLFEFSEAQVYGRPPLGTTPVNQRLSLLRSITDGVELFATDLIDSISDMHQANSQYERTTQYFKKVRTRESKKVSLSQAVDLEAITTDRWAKITLTNHPLVQAWQQLAEENEARKAHADTASVKVLHQDELDAIALQLLLAYDGEAIMKVAQAHDKPGIWYKSSLVDSIGKLLLLNDGV